METTPKNPPIDTPALTSRSAAWLTIFGAVGVGVVVTLALSDGTPALGGLAVPWWCLLWAFGINWLIFAAAVRSRSERLFDLTGSVTNLGVLGLALAAGPGGTRQIVVVFLFARVIRQGGDTRFEAFSRDPVVFLRTWTAQGLWVLLTLLPAVATTANGPTDVDLALVVGVVIAAAGLALEAVADEQKRRFRSDPSNDGRFITSGVWAWSRHPNYFGEIVLWVGITVAALPALEGWRWVAVVSPVFVYVLLAKGSGIPILETRGKKRWGDDPTYRAYLDRTTLLIPRPPRTT